MSINTECHIHVAQLHVLVIGSSWNKIKSNKQEVQLSC